MTDKTKQPGDAFAPRHEPMPQPLGDDEFYPEWVEPVANDNEAEQAG